MNKPVGPSRKYAALCRNRTLVLGVCVCAGLAGLAAPAQAQAQAQETELVNPTVVIPSHLTIGNQTFEASVTGLRDYVESIKATNPQLYAQLAPDVDHLESMRAAARAVLISGLAIGVASTIYAFASRNSCQGPSINDPDFAAKTEAWGACNQDNDSRTATFAAIGLVAAAAGGFGAFAITPSRSDLLEVVNKNNRLSPAPLQLQLGYDPGHQLAFAGATFTF